MAQALLARADRHGQETGAAFLMLSTATDNRQAQALYEGHGYQRDNEFYSYIKPL
ncbi:GNAT family N-acetyltransferase [Aeromonas caviae]|uniref:GNAT family N-acetyltransferase n=1 Tax=Aeromonas caviae TaxID=648 RepID=UPI001CC65931|nr:hypothetical protein [Aeromonas caviae]GJA14120.1 hypothetical protein KAM335_13160 [Aeromonas caviae]GJA22452.1 hypothetical protein KAM337_09800 [Aeromonas caviae]GJB19245.1 hypothetical protein KAM364_11570 [Aeromonas caviae]